MLTLPFIKVNLLMDINKVKEDLFGIMGRFMMDNGI
jgi:hypothetical protein